MGLLLLLLLFFFLKYRTNYGTKNGKEETGPKQVGANPEKKKKK
jgi:hypothetical protein